MMDTYRSAAKAGFDVLAQQYKTPNIFKDNFWFGGNTLHTCLNYLVAANETDATARILPAGFAIYKSLQGSNSWWKDDYGWWGIAFVVAINCRRQLGYADPSYDALFKSLVAAAQFCWKQLESNWRDKPYNEKVDGGTTDNAAGSADIGGGVFNNAPDSTLPPMSGRNSVTNEGFWILSQHLAKLIPDDPRYSQKAVAEHDWFAQWLTLPKGILNGQGLVLERPMGNQTDKAWYWSGDQGLFIWALSNAGEDANKIAKSVIANMADDKKVLHENMEFAQYREPGKDLHQFIADYATGKGIFMRNLVRLTLASPGRQAYSDFIKTNASAVWCNRSSAGQFTFNWDLLPGREPNILRVDGKSDQLCDLIMQAAGQDALNAAVYIAPDQAIVCPPAR